MNNFKAEIDSLTQQPVSQLVPSIIGQQAVGQLTHQTSDSEYTLSDIHKPMGVSEYQLTQALPENLKSSLPSIEEIEAELLGGRDE